MHRVRLLRAGVPVAQRHHHAAPADRDPPRDGAPARRLAGAAQALLRAVRVRRRSRRAPPTARASTPARWRSTPASWSRSCARRARTAPRAREAAGAARPPSATACAASAAARCRRCGVGGARAARRLCAARAMPAGRRPAGCPPPCARARRRSTCPPASTASSATRAGAPRTRRCPRRSSRSRARAGLPLWIPDDVAGHCCGTPWSSKGYARGPRADGRRDRARRCARWSDGGRLPVVIDASSCTHGADRGDRARRGRGARLDRLGPRPPARAPAGPARKLGRVAVHPTCASRHLGLDGKLRGDRRRASPTRSWSRPRPAAAGWPATAAGCTPSCRPRRCATSPRELDGAALRRLRLEQPHLRGRACRQVTGRPYASFVLALEEVTRMRRQACRGGGRGRVARRAWSPALPAARSPRRPADATAAALDRYSLAGTAATRVPPARQRR